MKEPFWKTKKLDEMNKQEWESLCDGCAKCCLHKLEDEETSEVHYTRVVCKYLEEEACRCGHYLERNDLVPQCVWLKPNDISGFDWLPASCAYRVVAEGRELSWWHPLVSGDPETVHQAGVSIRNKVISELHVHPESFDEHIVHWVND